MQVKVRENTLGSWVGECTLWLRGGLTKNPGGSQENKNRVLYICDFMKFDFESAAESSHMVTLQFMLCNSLNFGLQKNFLEVMKQEVNFEKVKDLADFMKFKFIAKLHPHPQNLQKNVYNT